MKKFFDNYPMLKEYEDIEPYMEELRDYANIFENIEIDRIEAKKQIVRDKKEIERLNNIINKLEKYIKNNKVVIGIKKDSNYAIPVEYVLDKLQELKGSDK